nr:hypothetical protein [Tanacetum cinerariifolium]
MQTQTSSVLHNDTFSSCSTSNVQEKTQLSRSRCMHSLREVKKQFKFLSKTLQDFGTMHIFKRTFSQDLDLLEQHLTKDILSQTDCKTTLKNLITKFENAFNSEFKKRMHKYTIFDAQSFKYAMICIMDSIGKYMLEIILHQQRTPHLLKQKKLMRTQEDHSNPIRALNVDSLKVYSVVIQNPCSEIKNSNSETASSKSVKESSLDSATKDVHAIKYKMSKAKERCMTYFRSLHSHLQVLSKEDLKGTRIEHGFTRTFMSLFGQDADTFTNKYFVEYTGIEVKHFRDTLLQHMGNVKKSVFERARHQRQYDRRVNKRLMQTQESKIDMGKAVNDDLVVTERQQHTEQPEIINEDEAKKKTQERDRNSKTSVITPTRFQSTADDSKPKPRSTNHSYRSLPISKSSCVTITAMPKADHSKSPSSFSDPTRFFCSTCNKCIFNANHDACITKLLKEVNSREKIQSHKTRDRNKPIDQKIHTQIPGRQIFTRHMFSPNKTSAVYEKISPRSDLSVDISKIHECKQTLNLSAGTSINVPKEQSLDPSAVTTADTSDKHQQQPDSTSSTSSLATTVTANGNFDL